MRIILASTSPRRRKLLILLGIPFDIIPPDVDESIYISNGDPIDYCCDLSKLKAENVGQHNPSDLVIGADTIVVLKNEILEKPADRTEAEEMLEKLSGQTHHVYTGVSILNINESINITFYERTEVIFEKLAKEDIQFYIDNFPPYDKAGSYGIQDWSAVFIKEINGCFNNVVGFPLSKFFKTLRALKVDVKINDKLLGQQN